MKTSSGYFGRGVAAAWVRTVWIACLLAFPAKMFGLDPSKSLHQYNCFSWNRVNGLPADNIASIAQGNDGYIWLGTQNGLIRFDGIGFKRVEFSLPGVQDNDIRAIAPSRQGGVWLAIQSSGFARVMNGKVAAIPEHGFATNGNPLTCIETRQGELWTSSEVGVRRLDGSGVSHWNGTKLSRVLAMGEDSNGNVWLGTADGDLWRANSLGFQRIDDSRLVGRVIFAVHAGRDRIWVGTGTGLLCYDLAGKPIEGPEIGVEVKALLVDRHDTLWVGTGRDGLWRWRSGLPTSLRRVHGLADDRVTSIAEDHEGSIWVGTQGGLTQLSDTRFPIFSSEEGLLSGTARAVTPTPGGGVWVGSTAGLAWLDGTNSHRMGDLPEMPNRYVKLLMQSRSGLLYVVDGERNLHVISKDRILRTHRNRDWPSAIADSEDGVIIAYGVAPFLVIERNGVLEPYRFSGSPPDYYWANTMIVARDNSIWIASNNGLVRVKDGQFQQWLVPQLPAARVYWVCEDSHGSIWAGTPGGIVRVQDGEVAVVTAKHGIPDERIYSMVQDDFGNWWIATGSGIVRINGRSLNECMDGKRSQLEAALFNGLESIKSNDRTDQEASACRSADGRIWFPTTLGVAMIDPVNHFTNTVPPQVRIEAVRVDDRTVTSLERGTITSQSRVEFDFAALSFISTAKMRVEYKLDGYDSEWREAGTQRTAVYDRLPPGQYHFHVRACNLDGIWNVEGADLPFAVPPPFYATWWFRAVSGLSAGLLLLGAYRWKVRQLAARQQRLQAANDELEARVRERTQELACERDLLRTLLDFSPDTIYFKDLDGRIVKLSRSEARNLMAVAVTRFRSQHPDAQLPAHLQSVEAFQTYAIGKQDSDFYDPEIACRFAADEREILRSGQPLVGRIEKNVLQDGRAVWHMTNKVPWRDPQGNLVGTFGTSHNITEIKEAEARADAANKRLIDLSREAGMAEVATGVLHNVGNVLNSINVSTTVLTERVRKSNVASVKRVADLCDEQGDRVGEFIKSDPRGRQLPKFLSQLAVQLIREQADLITELGELHKNVEHVKEIVGMQQSYAKVMGVTQHVSVVDVIEDALRLNEASLERHHIRVVRDFQTRLPDIIVDKHKLMQIVVNLIRNAMQACDESGRADKQIRVAIAQADGAVTISVTDNGVGIPKENLVRIFGHGFTTRKNGHGFGLHSGALAAKQMGGKLQVNSDGPGNGAVFTLTLPAVAT